MSPRTNTTSATARPAGKPVGKPKSKRPSRAMATRNVWLDPQLVAAVKKLARRKQTTQSAYVRSTYTDYLDNPRPLKVAPRDRTAHLKQVAYKVREDIHDQVLREARDHGLSVADVIRHGLLGYLTDPPEHPV